MLVLAVPEGIPVRFGQHGIAYGIATHGASPSEFLDLGCISIVP